MFARYFLELPIPADDVEHALSRDPRSWLPGLAEQANFKGDRLLAEVGVGGTIGLHRKVIIELGPMVHATSKSFFPLRWWRIAPIRLRGGSGRAWPASP